MQLTQEQKKELLALKHVPDSDDIRFKEQIKKKLIKDDILIYLLNNKELQDSEAQASDYIGVNIFPYYMIPPDQSKVENFVCFETRFTEIPQVNTTLKYAQIMFFVISNEQTIIEETTGVPRHDLLAARITQDFNWTNYFGTQVHLVRNEPSTVDKKYAQRLLVFEGKMPNSLAKTVNGVTRVVNNTGE